MARDYYNGPYIFAGSDYYVHKRKKNIGRAAGGDPQSDSAIASIFSKQKEQATDAAKAYYKELFIQNLKVDHKSLELLNEVFQKDDFMTSVDTAVKANMQKAVNTDELSRLRRNQNVAISAAKKMLSAPSVTAKMKNYDMFLSVLADTVSLVHGDPGGYLAKAILMSQSKGGKGAHTLKQYGEGLMRAMEYFITEDINDIYFTMSKQDEEKFYALISSLSGFANRLINNKTATKKTINQKNITDMVDALFSSGFSEVIGSQLQDVAEMAIDHSLTQVVGNKTTEIQRTDTRGNMTFKEKGTTAYGKTDIKFQNVNIKLDISELNALGGEITLDIGVSNKFYRTEGFMGALEKDGKLSFSSGSGGSLKEALESIFNSNYEEYLAYNALARGNQLLASNLALHNLILTRQINRLFATRGGVQDFSQFIFANGQVISIWELITFVANPKNSIGLSQSMEGSTNQGVVLHIKGRKDIIASLNYKNARKRVPLANQAIKRATISAVVHVEKLAQTIGN